MRIGGKAGGSAPDAMMCLTPSSAVAAVEIVHLAGADMGGADGQPRRALLTRSKSTSSLSVCSSGAVE